MLDAIYRNEFQLYYQPVYCLNQKQVAGYEVLSRWHHPQLGVLLPGQWIRFIESDPDLAWEFDKYVFSKAYENVIYLHGFHGVNITPSSLVNPELPEFLSTLSLPYLKQSLILEITERVSTIVGIESCIKGITDQGFELSLDDFGTGSNSLLFLSKLRRVSKLKIDKHFVDRVLTSEIDRSIVKSIVYLARELRISTIAEGIETKEQANFLWAIGCDYGQGYYFGKPELLRINSCSDG